MLDLGCATESNKEERQQLFSFSRLSSCMCSFAHVHVFVSPPLIANPSQIDRSLTLQGAS